MTDLLPWRISSFSGASSTCVQVADTGDRVLVRNSNHPDAGTLVLRDAIMAAWVAGVAAGDLDDLA